MDEIKKLNIEERVLKPANGIVMMILGILLMIVSIIACIMGGVVDSTGGIIVCIAGGIIGIIVSTFLLAGLHMVKPNEAVIFEFFGKYYGTIRQSGFFFINPFARSRIVERRSKFAANDRVSLKINTLNNDKQKVNDALGNPVLIGSIVVWKVIDPTKAVYNVENYKDYLSIQCDSIIRNVARLYPYDCFDDNESGDSNEKSLRGSSQEVADIMQDELQKRVADAGLEIIDVRISNLAYSEEIAAAMLQRQQATAIIAARQKIVEGAVGMVKMALEQLDEDEVVVLDEERKAAMISNLLVVLCSNKDAQPVVNNGSIY